MFKRGWWHLSRFLAVLMIAAATLVVVELPAKADPGDNYPDVWKNQPLGATYDTWGEATRYCTSWVAWALHDRDGYELPFYDFADNFGPDAKAKGITVDMNPAVGSVAWWGDAPWNNYYGHVAFVDSLNTDARGTITGVNISEYNNPAGSGTYNTRTISAGNPSGYIHFKDIDSISLPKLPPDVYLVQHWNSPSGMTEVKKIAVGASPPYGAWDGGWATQDGWHGGGDADYSMADYNADGRPDVYKIQHANTNSGMTEVQIWDGANGFRNFGGWPTPDGLHSHNDVGYVVADFNGDKKPDLFKILHWNSPSGTSEVQVFDGANNWRLFGGWNTPEGWHGGDDVNYIVSACGVAKGGRPNLYQISHQNTPSGLTEVKEYNGADYYQTRTGGWLTADGAHSGNDVSYAGFGCNPNGKPNLYVMLHNNTNNGVTQIKVLDGAYNWGRWVGGWSTPDGWHGGNDVDYVMGA